MNTNLYFFWTVLIMEEHQGQIRKKTHIFSKYYLEISTKYLEFTTYCLEFTTFSLEISIFLFKKIFLLILKLRLIISNNLYSTAIKKRPFPAHLKLASREFNLPSFQLSSQLVWHNLAWASGQAWPPVIRSLTSLGNHSAIRLAMLSRGSGST